MPVTGNSSLVTLGGVPTTRTLTINGTALDLSADRSWLGVTSIPTFGGLTINGTTQGIIAEITGFNAVNAGRFIIDSSDGSTVGALYASNDTNFAHSGFIGKFESKNATDSGPILSLANAGSGNYITADSAFSVTKAGNITGSGATLSGLTASLPVVTDGSKNLASVSYATFAGNIDHGSLAGLSDDDHSQYFLLTGRNGNVANLIQNNIQTTSTQTLLLANNTASDASITVQYAPALDFLGHARHTGIGAGDRNVRFRIENQPTSAASATGTLVIKSSVDTGTASFTNRLTLDTAGLLTTATGSFASLLVTGTGASSISIGGDIVLGRRTANVLAMATGDMFEAPNIGIGKNANSSIGAELLIPSGGQGFRIESGVSTNISFSTYVTADDFIRFGFLASGKMEWGPGSAGGDLTFERNGVASGLLTGSLTATVNLTAVTGTLTTSVLSPLFSRATSGATVVRGYDDTGGVATGGNLTVRAGNGQTGKGATAPGNLIFQNATGSAAGLMTFYKSDGTTKLFEMNDTGIGFFAATPVAQQAGIVDADGTLADITTKFNNLLAKLEAYRLLAVA